MNVDVVVVGSLNLDRTYTMPVLPDAGETLHATGTLVSSGGKGANQAVAASKLGARVALAGAVGCDDAGDAVLGAVSRAGVDTSLVRRIPDAPTGEAVILVDREGRNLIVVTEGANAAAVAPEPSAAVEAKVVVGGFEVRDETVIGAAALAESVGALFVLNPSPFRPLPAAIAGRVDVLVVNEHELAEAAGVDVDTESDAALVSARADLGAAALVVTLGARGAVAVADDGSVVRVPAVTVQATDTSGAGDAFMGALVARLAAGASMVDAVAFATAVGSYSATNPGTQLSYPTLAELEDWMVLPSAVRSRM